ncbi:MAG TPA: ferritin-like domain-containing protein [Thermoleophilaceae bacterium]|jgi:rubrerythrin
MNPTIAGIQVHGMTRGAFLARSALAAGALYGAAAAGPALTRTLAHEKHGAFGGGDVAILNFALTLERIEVDFYKRALAVQGVGADAKKLLQSIAGNEGEHVQALNQSIAQLGGKADPAPRTNFPALANEEQVLRLAIDLEDSGVAAYNGAATQIVSADVLQAVASIAQVEARHAGALRALAGESPTDGPFDDVLSGAEADAVVHRLTG